MSEANDPSTVDEGGWIDRVSLSLARIPFKLKVAAVWICIFVILGVLFWLSKFDVEWMREHFEFIAGGLKFTIYLAVGGIVLAIVLATIGALGRISHNPIAYGISGFYVSFFRGTPLIVQMFLLYLALPQIGSNLVDRFPGLGTNFSNALILDAVWVGILALGLNYGAYMTEIFRAGIESVAGGQGEAADALGMKYGQKMRKVVLPQAFRVIIPPTGNEFIAMMKDTALVSFLGVIAANSELFWRATKAGRRDFHSLEALIVAAGLYWALTALFTVFQRRLEAKVSRGYVRAAGKTSWRRRPNQTAAPELDEMNAITRGHGGGGGGTS